MLNDIVDKLKEFDLPVCYGLVTEKDVPQGSKWNYFVIKRKGLKKDSQKWYQIYAISIVMEDYIVEGFELDIIDKLAEINVFYDLGVDISYNYSSKGNTDEVVEIATITFKKKIRSCT